MLASILIVILSETKFFASFDLLESLSSASIMYQRTNPTSALTFSSFSKNDLLISRRIREISLNTALFYALGRSRVKFSFEGTDRMENDSKAKTFLAGVNSILPFGFGRFSNEAKFEVQRLSGTIYSADNSGVTINSGLEIGSDSSGVGFYANMDRKRLINKRLYGVRYNLTLLNSTLHSSGKSEYEINSYELAGIRDTGYRKGGELELGFHKKHIQLVAKGHLWDYRYAVTTTRNHIDKTAESQATAELPIVDGNLRLSFSTGIDLTQFSTISLWQRRIFHQIEANYTLGWYYAHFRAVINRLFFPPLKPDDRDERIVESSVGLNNYGIGHSVLNLSLGVKQNDFVFIRSERSANTRTRKTYFVRSSYDFSGPVTVSANGELAAFYTLYRFRESGDMLLRYLDMSVEVEKNIGLTGVRFQVREKLSDYGRYFESVYYRRSKSYETWVSAALLIRLTESFNLKLHAESYTRKELMRVYSETKIGLGGKNEHVNLDFSMVRRGEKRFPVLSLSFQRGF